VEIFRRVSATKRFIAALCGSVVASFFIFSVIGHAQAAGGETVVAVTMTDGVDSTHDPVGRQYRASVARAVKAGNTTIPQGSAAVVTLQRSQSGTPMLQLTALVVNGQTLQVSGMQAGASATVASVQDKINSLGIPGLSLHKSKPNQPASNAKVAVPAGNSVNFVVSQNSLASAQPNTAQPNIAQASTAQSNPNPAVGGPVAQPAQALSPTPQAAPSGGYLTFATRLYTPNGCTHNGTIAICSFSVVNRGNDVTLYAGGGGAGELGNLQFVDDAHVPHGPQAKYFIDKYGTRQGSFVLGSGQTGNFVVEFANVNPLVTTGDFKLGDQFLSGISVQGNAGNQAAGAGPGH
jgi:hypothetical protein